MKVDIIEAVITGLIAAGVWFVGDKLWAPHGSPYTNIFLCSALGYFIGARRKLPWL
jgi:hypothetical protein